MDQDSPIFSITNIHGSPQIEAPIRMKQVSSPSASRWQQLAMITLSSLQMASLSQMRPWGRYRGRGLRRGWV
ncbi:uncharacterized protein CIMG_11803 [Coccidioides immitis RS]|uniref:Uncharacterized protein n=1 Tax=Coccidioides immitis (strain RS) TaxID=246410 RepID=A0A0D8JUL0_COCIM|nr:uncharacterized protein CIMG_11803 [Coccidioides immitis RS]KJF60611.1 hypothetical protein CIMG_11803 [Coccidioides immitis RS]